MGPGFWKMNSSVVRDNAYKREIEEAVDGINRLEIDNPMDWWDLFIMVVRSITKTYTTKKAYTKNSLKSYILHNIQRLENIQYSDKTDDKTERAIPLF